jgi:hypothetical protein
VTIKVIFNDSRTVTLGFLSSHLQELLCLFIPSIYLYPFFLTEINESADFEHIIFGLQTVGDDVRTKRYQFNSLELTADLPADVVHAKLQSLWTI